MKTGDGVGAAASVFRPDAACGKDSALVAPAVVSEVETDGLGHGPSAGAGVPRAVALVESPVSPAVKACSCSGVELLVAAVPETEPVTVWVDFKPSLSSAAAAAELLASADARVALQASASVSSCWAGRLGSEVEVTLLVTGAETLKDLGENKPEIPQSKTRQIFKLRRNIVPKYLKAEINPQLHISFMKANKLVLDLDSFIFMLRQKI